MEDIQRKLDDARRELYEYNQLDGVADDGKSLVDIADLMVENQLFLDKIDQVLGKPSDTSNLDNSTTGEEDELTDSLINALYLKAQAKSKGTFKEAQVNT